MKQNFKMIRKYFFIAALSFWAFLSTMAQSISFPDDELERGYYQRPYLRYEAEVGKCETNGTILQHTFDQREIQTEASNFSAIQLIMKDSYIQWTNEKADRKSVE